MAAEYSGSQSTSYLYGLDTIGQYSNGSWSYWGTDKLGSVRQITDSLGSLHYSANYGPYGKPMDVVKRGRLSNFGFTGEQTDSNGLDFLRARYYSPTLGTMLSRDPVQGGLDRSGSRNGYSYVEDNPANYRDPSGMCDTAFESNFFLCGFQNVAIGSIGLHDIGQIGFANDVAHMATQNNPAQYQHVLDDLRSKPLTDLAQASLAGHATDLYHDERIAFQNPSNMLRAGGGFAASLGDQIYSVIMLGFALSPLGLMAHINPLEAMATAHNRYFLALQQLTGQNLMKDPAFRFGYNLAGVSTVLAGGVQLGMSGVRATLGSAAKTAAITTETTAAEMGIGGGPNPDYELQSMNNTGSTDNSSLRSIDIGDNEDFWKGFNEGDNLAQTLGPAEQKLAQLRGNDEWGLGWDQAGELKVRGIPSPQTQQVIWSSDLSTIEGGTITHFHPKGLPPSWLDIYDSFRTNVTFRAVTPEGKVFVFEPLGEGQLDLGNGQFLEQLDFSRLGSRYRSNPEDLIITGLKTLKDGGLRYNFYKGLNYGEIP
ncbi:MAG: RHS repeat-associated core domain-containing protein [Chloroflexota bacterium]